MWRRVRRGIAALAVLLATVLIVYIASGIVRSQYLEASYESLVLPSRTGITGTLRIVQVSDLHLAVYGENNSELVALVASKAPDIIVSTGDMIDSRAESLEPTIDLYRRLVQIAPVAYSMGNHELAREDWPELAQALRDIGVIVLQNEAVDFDMNGLVVRIGGVYRAEHLRMLGQDTQMDILLCHFPHQLSQLAAYGIPLAFCGHAHGGQFRIPAFDIALYAPGQGWFPRYTAGLYTQGDSRMIVSRGLGNSIFPFRVHNPPEIVVADITFAMAIPSD